MSSIINKLKQDIKQEGKSKNLIRLHHDFMSCYGWIPIKEFEKIPSKTLFNLNYFIQKDKQKESQFMYSVLRGLGIKDGQLKWLK